MTPLPALTSVEVIDGSVPKCTSPVESPSVSHSTWIESVVTACR